MAKKDKKKKDKAESGAADAVEAVRAAVERTFKATTEGAAGTQRRTRDLVDEVAHAAARIRETIEELRVLDDLRGLRAEVEALSRRVAALEAAGEAAKSARPAAKKPAATRARSSGAKPAAREEEGNLHWEWSDDVDWEPKVRMAMSSETANRYFQGKENVAMALARRRIKAGGDVKAALSLIPITKPIYARYTALVEAEYPHLRV